MATNVEKVREFQRKIDIMAHELPTFVSRFELLIPRVTVENLLEQPPLYLILNIIQGHADVVLTPPVNGNVVSDEITTEKMWEYRTLRGNVITYFQRLLTVVEYASLSNLCANAGPNILAEYQDYLARQPEEIEAADGPQDLGSSSSSEEDN